MTTNPSDPGRNSDDSRPCPDSSLLPACNLHQESVRRSRSDAQSELSATTGSSMLPPLFVGNGMPSFLATLIRSIFRNGSSPKSRSIGVGMASCRYPQYINLAVQAPLGHVPQRLAVMSVPCTAIVSSDADHGNALVASTVCGLGRPACIGRLDPH